MEKSINQLLEIVGRQVDVSRVYIFEDDEDGSISSNTFEWCKEGIQPEKENLQSIDMDSLDHYYDNFSEEGIFFCRDVSTLLTHQRMLLESQGIKSVLQCRIMDQGKPRGFIGFCLLYTSRKLRRRHSPHRRPYQGRHLQNPGQPHILLQTVPERCSSASLCLP